MIRLGELRAANPIRKLALLVCVITLFSVMGNAADREIVVFGQNTSERNLQLGVTSTRTSCSLSAQECIESGRKLLAGQKTKKLYLNLPVQATKIETYAAYYSKASLDDQWVYELAVDDFLDHFREWCLEPGISCESLLNRVIDKTKLSNSKLQFGVTIYENEIDQILANPHLNSDLRKRIDTVHLYMFIRADGSNFQRYVGQIKRAFPKAKIIGGSYSYDRLDYEPCKNCSSLNARALHKQLLQDELHLLESGVIFGIEFYPGFFGLEDKWPSWDDPRMCAPTRKQQCIDNTKVMHEDAGILLRKAK
jgi:hypothetical protein